MRNVNNCCICALIYLIRFVESTERTRNNRILIIVKEMMKKLKVKLGMKKRERVIKMIKIPKIEKD